MRDMEGALRGAMAGEVADVSLPAGFAGQVRARHRRHRRIRVSATLASVVALVVAVPLATTAVLRDTATPPPADAPAVDEVDGVELTYLPDGLVRDPADGFDYGGGSMTGSGWTGWSAVTGRWHPDSGDYWRSSGYLRGMRISVVRGDDPGLRSLADSVTGRPIAEPVEESGRLVLRSDIPFGGEWVDVFWPAGDGVTLRVRVSDDLEHELERVIDGIRVTGPGEPFLVNPEQAPPPADGGFCDPATNLPVLPPGRSADWNDRLPRDVPLGSEWDRFGGVTLGYAPDGLTGGLAVTLPVSGLNDGAGPSEAGGAPDRWISLHTYRFDDEPYGSVVVEVTCGSEFPLNDEQLAAHLGTKTAEPATPEPYPMARERPAYTVDGHFDDEAGQRVGWLERPGVVVEVSVSGELVGQLDEIVDGIQLREPGGAAPEGAATGCPLPELRPGMLPWLSDGEPVPDPVEVRFGTVDEPTSLTTWAADADPEELWNVAHLSIGRIHTPEVEPGDQGFEMVEVRGNEAELVWVGDPGMGQLRVNWREQPGPCGVYSVWLGTYDAWWLDTPVVDGQPCEEYSEECAAEFQRLLEVAIIEVADSLE